MRLQCEHSNTEQFVILWCYGITVFKLRVLNHRQYCNVFHLYTFESDAKYSKSLVDPLFLALLKKDLVYWKLQFTSGNITLGLERAPKTMYEYGEMRLTIFIHFFQWSSYDIKGKVMPITNACQWSQFFSLYGKIISCYNSSVCQCSFTQDILYALMQPLCQEKVGFYTQVVPSVSNVLNTYTNTLFDRR